jgi:hypothetical protein
MRLICELVYSDPTGTATFAFPYALVVIKIEQLALKNGAVCTQLQVNNSWASGPARSG